jgi:NADH-quinone oxidoreductase subunit A
MIELRLEAGVYGWFLLVGLAFVSAGLFIASLLRATYIGEGARIAYECGEQPEGTPWLAIRPRYYGLALVFLLFEIELALLFPWSLAAYKLGREWVWLAVGEGVAFIVLLGLGLVFAWGRGILDAAGPMKKQVTVWEGTAPETIYSTLIKTK